MISSPLFSVIIEQKLDLATIITAVIAVLAWVFPFPDIGEKDKNNKDNQQEKAPKRNYYLKYRIIVFLICLAVLGVLSYKSNAGTGNPPASTLPPQETEIVSTPEITPEPTPEITPEPTPEITPEPTPEITPEPKNIIQQPQDLEVYPSARRQTLLHLLHMTATTDSNIAASSILKTEPQRFQSLQR